MGAEEPVGPVGPSLGRALFRVWDGRYAAYAEGAWAAWWGDVVAGGLVALVAIPLAVGVALACQLHPAQGVLAGSVAGVVGALVGGSRWQSYGPSPALIPVASGVVVAYGLPPLLLAMLLAGALVVALGWVGGGAWFRRVPTPVLQGFGLAVALGLALGQLPWALGLRPPSLGLGDRLLWLLQHLGALRWEALGLCAFTLALLAGFARLGPRVPGPLLALGLAALWPWLPWSSPDLPQVAQALQGGGGSAWWQAPAWGAAPGWAVLGAAASIALVVALEGLLSARVLQGLGAEASPLREDKELVGLGLCQLACAAAACVPTTGSLARGVVNVQAGAQSPVASVVKALVMAGSVGVAAPLLGALPLAAVAGLLLHVAWKLVPRPLLAWPRGAEAWAALAWALGTAAACLALGLAWGVLLAWALWAWGPGLQGPSGASEAAAEGFKGGSA